MGTHPIFESDFDCLTVDFFRMLVRAAGSSLARRAGSSKPIFQTKAGILYTPPRFANAYDISPSGKYLFIGGSLCFSFCIIFDQLSRQKELLATKEYVALKYATLEESDTLLQMKLNAHRLSLAEDEDE